MADRPEPILLKIGGRYFAVTMDRLTIDTLHVSQRAIPVGVVSTVELDGWAK